jgi:preflagellin peptidase FlaK
MIISCSWILGIELITEGFPCFASLLLSLVVVGIAAMTMYASNSVAGGDVKGLLTLAMLFPTYPTGEIVGIAFPLLGDAPLHIFTATVLVNAVFVSLIAPIGLYLYNITHFEPEMWENLKFMCMGYMTTKEDLDKKQHTELLAWREDSEGNIIGRVWVTPLLPYMIFITIGFIIAVITGI